MEISKGAQQAGGGEWEVLSGPEHWFSSSHTLLSQDKLRFPVRLSVRRLLLAFLCAPGRGGDWKRILSEMKFDYAPKNRFLALKTCAQTETK